MVTMNDFLLFNAAVDANGATTAPFPVGLQNNAISITLTVISGTTGASGVNPMQVQFSNDGVSWSAGTTVNVTGFDSKTGPTYVAGGTGALTTSIPRLARIVFKGPASGYCIVNLSASPCRL